MASPETSRTMGGGYPALFKEPIAGRACTNGPPKQLFPFQMDRRVAEGDILKGETSGRPSLLGKRPVMFYMHVGGSRFGPAYELASQDGAQMARHHDVVSVTVNHRLNILGFLDVSSLGGPAYADSVSAEESKDSRSGCLPSSA